MDWRDKAIERTEELLAVLMGKPASDDGSWFIGTVMLFNWSDLLLIYAGEAMELKVKGKMPQTGLVPILSGHF